MRELLNSLYLLTQGTSLHLDHDAVVVRLAEAAPVRLPLLRLEALVCFGRVNVSPSLIHRCAEDGRAVVWLDRGGRFKCRAVGPVGGNVLLRRAQHLHLDDSARTLALGQQFVAAKIQNSRQVLMRGSREAKTAAQRSGLARTADHLSIGLSSLGDTADLNQVRGIEGESARSYFASFPALIRTENPFFAFQGRSKRPPRDAVNALLSFLYTLLRNEVAAALEGVGLDPQVGYLHSLRPGRPALALDLMEELRPVVADRLALTLLNREQLKEPHFEALPGGAVFLSDGGRRIVLDAYQRRKAHAVTHGVLREKVPLGLLPHLQARLLARHLRGDLPHYPPFLYR